MAVAAENSNPRSKNASDGMGLLGVSLIGALLVIVFVSLVLRGVPWLWQLAASSMDIKDQIVLFGVQAGLQLTAAGALLYAGSRLGTGRKATGIRGGIFLMMSVGFVSIFSADALFHISDHVGKVGLNFGSIVAMLFHMVILFLIVQMFRTGRFTRWSLALDQAGWFDTHTHKRTQGLLVRRLTIVGFLGIAITGIWTLFQHNYLPQNADVRVATSGRGDLSSTEQSDRRGDWVIFGATLEPLAIPSKDITAVDKEKIQIENRGRPRVEGGFTLLPDLKFTIPMILFGLSGWLAWRVVNYPTFADFLIATEAEINKVSWSSRKALYRDTIVVLVSLVLLTLFLFVVDMFWSWFLSQEWVMILPTQSELPPKEDSKPVTEW